MARRYSCCILIKWITRDGEKAWAKLSAAYRSNVKRMCPTETRCARTNWDLQENIRACGRQIFYLIWAPCNLYLHYGTQIVLIMYKTAICRFLCLWAEANKRQRRQYWCSALCYCVIYNQLCTCVCVAVWPLVISSIRSGRDGLLCPHLMRVCKLCE